MIKPLKAFKKLGYEILPVLMLLDKECPKTKNLNEHSKEEMQRQPYDLSAAPEKLMKIYLY